MNNGKLCASIKFISSKQSPADWDAPVEGSPTLAQVCLSTTPVNDGNWHTVQLDRLANNFNLQVDHNILSLLSSLYLFDLRI